MPSLLDGHVPTVIRFAACALFRALPIFIVLIGMCVSNVLKCGNKKRIEIELNCLCKPVGLRLIKALDPDNFNEESYSIKMKKFYYVCAVIGRAETR